MKRTVATIIFVLSIIMSLVIVSILVFQSVITRNYLSLDFLRGVIKEEQIHAKASVKLIDHQRSDLWLAMAELRKGNPDRALVLIENLETKSDPLVSHLRGQAIWAQGDEELAIQIWNEIQDYQSLAIAAYESERSGKLDIAYHAYQAASTVSPVNGTLPYVAFIVRSNRDTDGAILTLQNAVVNYPNSPYRINWLEELAGLLERKERWDEAKNIYEELIGQDPNNWRAHIDLGWLYYELGYGVNPALDEFNKAIDNVSGKAFGYLAIANLMRREQRFFEADEWYSRAILLMPENRAWLLARAEAAREGGFIHSAINIYEQITSQFPDWHLGHYHLARTYQINGEHLKATGPIETAIALTPSPPAHYYILAGEIYESGGLNSKAIWAYLQVLDIMPNHQGAQEGIKRVGP
jgi:tetratricopeptide (TPR) repeat protein